MNPFSRFQSHFIQPPISTPLWRRFLAPPASTVDWKSSPENRSGLPVANMSGRYGQNPLTHEDFLPQSWDFFWHSVQNHDVHA